MRLRSTSPGHSLVWVLLAIGCGGPVPPYGGSEAEAAAGATAGPVLVGNLGSGGSAASGVSVASGTAPASPGSPSKPVANTGGSLTVTPDQPGTQTANAGGMRSAVPMGGSAGAVLGSGGMGGAPEAGRCGDGVVSAALGETCDDGNGKTDDECPDGTLGTCRLASCTDGLQLILPIGMGEADIDCGGPVCGACPGELLISEVVVSPTGGEYIEIVNPSAQAISLEHVYLADYPAYFTISHDPAPPHSSDFRLAFPPDSKIAPRSYVVVALKSATEFFQIYGRYPDYDLSVADTHAASMLGAFSGASGLSDGDEMVVLFRYVPKAERISDLDYVVYGNSSDAVDKSSSALQITPYLPDTPALAQRPARAPKGAQQALARCSDTEEMETKTGGNGYLGHDETSEALDESWRVLQGPTPQAPPLGCPVPAG